MRPTAYGGNETKKRRFRTEKTGAENSREQFNFVMQNMQMQMQIQQQQMQQQFQMQQQQTQLFAALLEKN